MRTLQPEGRPSSCSRFYPANLLIPVGPILSIPFDDYFYIFLHYIPSHISFLHLQWACNYPWIRRENSLPCNMGILSVVNICLIHFLIQRVRGPFGIPTSHLLCFYTLFAQGFLFFPIFFFFFFFFFFFLPLSLQPAVLPATFPAKDERSKIRGDRHNKSQSAEMKINDCPNRRSLKSGLKHGNAFQMKSSPWNIWSTFAQAPICRYLISSWEIM